MFNEDVCCTMNLDEPSGWLVNTDKSQCPKDWSKTFENSFAKANDQRSQGRVKSLAPIILAVCFSARLALVFLRVKSAASC